MKTSWHPDQGFKALKRQIEDIDEWAQLAGCPISAKDKVAVGKQLILGLGWLK